MGMIRMLLALSVVLAHSNETIMVGGQIAVQLFYIISGFLMSLILNEKNIYNDPVKFYINRALRIYPIYFSVALLSLLAQFVANPSFFELYEKIPSGAQLFLIFSNIFIFGQDWIMFSGIENGNLVFLTDFSKSEALLYTGLLVPQAWTLGVELCFYLIAPFVLRSVKTTILLLVLSLLLRIILLNVGLGMRDPWTYRFFPSELALFLAGALAHRLLLPRWQNAVKKLAFVNIDVIFTFFLIAFIISYSFLPVVNFYKATFLYACFLFFLPLAFLYQKIRPIDKLFGDLSYPLYIGHLLVIWMVAFFCKRIDVTNGHTISLINILGAMIFAIGINFTISKKIEAVRSSIRESKNVHIGNFLNRTER
jgi:peptidoglycan/LPS O-acetylase OafA/YrhL